MDTYLELYQNNPLFADVRKEDLMSLLVCLQAQKRSFPKGSLIFSAGERSETLGIVLTGRVNSVYEDMFGGRSIIGAMEPGQLFCDAFCCATGQNMPVSIMAQSDSTVLLIDIQKILHTCAHACVQHQRLTENLLHILADKYVTLSKKMIHLSGRTTRRKLLSYLSEQARQFGGPFSVPFTQQELADYLFIDRSGLSTEWNRLKREGILRQVGKRYALQASPCFGLDCSES